MAGSIPTVAPNPSLSWVLATSPTPEQLPGLASGDLQFRAKWNEALALLEALARYAVGAHCVLDGLELSASSGLTVQVNTGIASIDGLVVLKSPVPHVVPASTAAAYLWLKQDAVVVHTLTASPPAGKAVYLGQVETNASEVVAVDEHGVLRSRGGMLWRALPSPPSDLPPGAVRLWTQVGASIYLWDGTAHKLIVP